jgi:transcriptional regulator with XRE-family HTH domain
MPEKLSDQIRMAIEKSGMTRYRLAAEARVDQGALSRFMSGKSGLSMAALDRISEIIGLSVRIEKREGE